VTRKIENVIQTYMVPFQAIGQSLKLSMYYVLIHISLYGQSKTQISAIVICNHCIILGSLRREKSQENLHRSNEGMSRSKENSKE
jgi:hypothetical protein